MSIRGFVVAFSVGECKEFADKCDNCTSTSPRWQSSVY